MKPMVAVGAAIFALSVTATGAQAHWKYTRWGMTTAEIIEASGGQAQAAFDGPNLKCAFNGKYVIATIPRTVIAGQPFQVVFCSTDGRALESVTLRYMGNPVAIERMLLSEYGQPISSGGDTIRTIVWNDRKSANTVTFYDTFGLSGVIEYKAAGGRGL